MASTILVERGSSGIEDFITRAASIDDNRALGSSKNGSVAALARWLPVICFRLAVLPVEPVRCRMLSDSRILIAKKQAVIMLIGILKGAIAESLPRDLNVRD